MSLITLPHAPKNVYRLAVGTFFFLQGLVFAIWASRIPDIKQALGLALVGFGTASVMPVCCNMAASRGSCPRA